MLATKGSNWLSRYSGGKAWCKLIRHADEIDLSRQGNYAINAPFVDFDTQVLLDDHMFLLVASQYPMSTPGMVTNLMNYQYALVEIRDQKPSLVQSEALYRTSYKVLDDDAVVAKTGNDTALIIPSERRHSALGSMPYMMGIYCVHHYRRLKAKIISSVRPSAVAGTYLDTTRRPRKIVRAVLTPKPEAPAPRAANKPEPGLTSSKLELTQEGPCWAPEETLEISTYITGEDGEAVTPQNKTRRPYG